MAYKILADLAKEIGLLIPGPINAFPIRLGDEPLPPPAWPNDQCLAAIGVVADIHIEPAGMRQNREFPGRTSEAHTQRNSHDRKAYHQRSR